MVAVVVCRGWEMWRAGRGTGGGVAALVLQQGIKAQQWGTVALAQHRGIKAQQRGMAALAQKQGIKAQQWGMTALDPRLD